MQKQEFQSPYPGYNVLDKWSSPDWDDQTRAVVRKRLEQIPPIRFFTDQEVRTLNAIADPTAMLSAIAASASVWSVS